MIEARKNKMFEYFFSLYNRHILGKQFFRIRISGEENFTDRKSGLPVILYSNHSNWWDGLVCFYLSYNFWKTDAYMMMDIRQMRKYKFFRYIGAFSVNRESAFDSYETIRYSCNLLKDKSRVLWIFPQGEMLPSGRRPLKFQRGAARVAEMAGGALMIPVAVSYEFLMEQRAEIFITVGKPAETGKFSDTDMLTSETEKLLEEQLDRQEKMISEGRTENFRIIFGGKKSRNRIIDKFTDG